MNRIKIQDIELMQSEFVINTIKKINEKLEKENERLNSKVEKFNDYLMREHDEEIKKYRSFFSSWTREQSFNDYRSRSTV